MKVSSIELLFDKWMYVSNPRNDNFDDLTFYCEKSLITGRQIYSVNDDNLESLNNGSIFGVYTNWI